STGLVSILLSTRGSTSGQRQCRSILNHGTIIVYRDEDVDELPIVTHSEARVSLAREFDARPGVETNNNSADTPAPLPSSPYLDSLFHQHWWLNAVSNGAFEEAQVTAGTEVVGRLPFVVTRKLGFTQLGMPPYTHVLGPIVTPGSGKFQTQLLRRL